MSDGREQSDGMPSGDELAASALKDAADLVDDDRDTHGDAVENQTHIANGWTWYLRGCGLLGSDQRITGDDAATMMAIVKMSRHGVGDKDVDHMRDIAGYGGIGAACMVYHGDADVSDVERGAYEDAHLEDADE